MRATSLPAKQTTWEQVQAYVLSMSWKARIGSLAAVLGIVGACFLSKNVVESYDYQSLYPLKLDQSDVREISRALTQEHIDHRISSTGDQVTVAPEHLMEAQIYLAGLSLPRNKPVVSKDDAKIIRTKLEQEAAAKQELEDGLAYTLKELAPIADARVQIAVPEHSLFQNERESVKASVYLRMTPGEELDQETARGMASLVAHSVPDLSVENVGIFDYYGREINAKKRPEDFHDEVQKEKEDRLQAKLQEALAKLYGPDRVHAVVDLTLDFSEEESRRYTPGSAADDGMVKDSIQLVHEMLEGGSKEDGKKYDQRKEAVNYKYMENYYAQLRKAAKVDRITATVLVDGAAPNEVDTIKAIVRGSIGIDETDRQDAVFVSTLPWNHPARGMWETPPTQPPVARQSPSNASAPVAAAVLLTMLGCGAAGYLMRRSQPVMGVALGGAGSSQPAGIVDHHRHKTGYGSAPEARTGTQVGTITALESLVGDRPTEVAALLRTTWLSEN